MTVPTRRALLIGAPLVVVAIYVAYGAALYFGQDRLLFPAPQLSAHELHRRAEAAHADEIAVAAADGTALYGWHRRAGGDRAVIYAHGNGDTCASRVDLYDHLGELGWDVIAVSYRGYPGSAGAPSEAGIELDMRAFWRYATVDLAIPPDRVVLHGFSLGGGAIGTIIDEVKPGAIVFESTFASIWDIASRRARLYPVSYMLNNPFRTIDRAAGITAPTLVVHGTADLVIPVADGRRLAAAIPGATYIEVPRRGHVPSITVGTDEMRAYEGVLAQISPVPDR